MKYIAANSIVSQVLNLADDIGYNRIKDFMTPSMVKECRSQCKDVYPMASPIAIKKPPKDPELGTHPGNTALSCMDIKLNGGPINSGKYWV